LTLSCVDSPNRQRSLIRLLHRRSITVQQYLSFVEIPLPERSLWDRLNVDQRRVVLEALARLIAKTALESQEESDD
jgi:hypothetical protein